MSSSAARWRARLPKLLWNSAGLHGALKRLYYAGAGAHRAVTAAPGAAYAKRREAYAQAITQADLLCGISLRTLALATSFGANTPRTVVMPIVLSHIKAIWEASAERRRNPITPQRPFRFGYIGAHAREKGIELLVAAFKGIRREEATLDCHGGAGADYLAHVKSLVDPANPPVFHGRYRQPDLASLLRDIDVGIVPSLCEDTAPNTVLEFQAAGIPVIGSRIGGIPEQIDDGGNGMLVAPGDEAALRGAMRRVIAEPGLVAAWRARAPNSFEPEGSWRRMEQLFLELAAAR